MNHEECEKLVRREVIYCVSTLIGELAGKDDYMDDLLPVLMKPQYTHTFTGDCYECTNTYELSDEEPQDEITTADDHTIKCPSCSKDTTPCVIEAEEVDPLEALEHWIVSNWLANKLEARGEMIVRDFLGLTIWGRTGSGQAISIDSVIEDIVADMMQPAAV